MSLENAEQTRDKNAVTEVHPLAQEAGDAIAALGQRQPWHCLLTEASPSNHIVQLYQDQQFLNRAVCRFAAGAWVVRHLCAGASYGTVSVGNFSTSSLSRPEAV